MLRPWPTSTTAPLSVLSLLLACSSVGVEQDPISTDSNETGDASGSNSNDPTNDPTKNPTTDAPTGGQETNTSPQTGTSNPTSLSSTDPTPSTGPDSESISESATTATSEGSTATTSGTTGTADTTGADSSSSGSTGVPEGCDDGDKNGDETDVDCGGSCSPCPLDGVCALDADCDSANCTDMACAEATCEDTKQNGAETDIDCGGGGGVCDACIDGDSCLVATDCENKVCSDNICQPAACDDKVKNQDESDIDCGGETCDGCANDKKCAVDDDCADEACVNNICIAATCSDGKQNGPETGIDCGGPSCAPCQLEGLILNEVDYDQVGDDLDEFIEIFNNTGADVDLADVRLVLVNGSNSATYLNLSLAPAGVLKQGQYLVAGSATVVLPPDTAFVKFAKAKDNIQNGSPDGIALVDLGDMKLLDALSYKGPMTMATVTGLGVVSLVEGTALKTQVGDSNMAIGSLIRFPNGNDKNDANTEWLFGKNPTPGAANKP